MKPLAVAALVLSLVGAAILAGVFVHEWDYYRGHPYRTGVSGVLMWASAGGFLGCLAVAALALSTRRS
jgi:hypothetical protein